MHLADCNETILQDRRHQGGLMIRLLMVLAVLLALASCKNIDSTPIFEDGRLNNIELDQLAGTYVDKESRLTLRRASSTTDLLSWSMVFKDKTGATGKAILSRIPGTKLYLTVLMDVEIRDKKGEVGPLPGNKMILMRRPTPTSLVVVKSPQDEFLDKMLKEIKAPAIEATLIKEYLTSRAAELNKLKENRFMVALSPRPAGTAGDGSASGASAKEAAAKQCRAKVKRRLLYCREFSELRSNGAAYWVECPGGSRSAKRACRGGRWESTFPSGNDPYYCDPETKVQRPTKDGVAKAVCR
ncbi:MAG: hypothetical protein AAFV19_21700 [Pseudomonadota bacterium]